MFKKHLLLDGDSLASMSTVWKQQINYAPITRQGIAVINGITPIGKNGIRGLNAQKLVVEEPNKDKDGAKMKLRQVVSDKACKKNRVTEPSARVGKRINEF